MASENTQVISYNEETLGAVLLGLHKGDRLEVELLDPHADTDEEMLEVPSEIQTFVCETVDKLYDDFDHVILVRFSFSSIMFYKWATEKEDDF